MPAPDPARASAHIPDYERVIAYVRDLVAAGAPGDPLPSITELAERLSVGTTTVKNALRELRRAGQIRTHPGKGMFVPGEPPDEGGGGEP